MIICNVTNLVKFQAANRVLDGISLEVHDDSRIGLVGPNGSGKSTLLRLIAAVDMPDEGSITRRRGLRTAYLPQEPAFPADSTVLDEALNADSYLAGLEQEIAELETRMSEPEVYEDPGLLQQTIDDHADALKRHEELGGLNVESRVLANLKALGFEEDDYLTPADDLSGGQKKLLWLARILASEPELLVLDEPDNHLDTSGKQKLERIIAEFDGAVVVVSHDRYLLDVVVESIAELEAHGQHPGRPQLSVFHGNYSEYAVEKRQALLQQQHSFDLQQREIKRLRQAYQRLMDWSQYVSHNKFIRRAQNIERRIERMDTVERPILEPKRMGLQLDADRGGFKVLQFDTVKKSFGEVKVLEGVDLLITHGERVALTGENGAGKSLLLKIALGSESADSGTVQIGARIRPGYYSQEQESLDPDSTLVEELRSVKDMSESQAYAFLGSFLFDYHRARRTTSTLSGGEKARLQMAKLMLSQGNLLLLDEPTNNLDIPSCEVLEDAIQQFEGTVLMISHDRYFLERTATRTVELVDGKAMEVK